MSRFAAVPTAALDDERLEALHIRVLTALCSYADKDGWCRVGQDLIAARARTNPARVSQCISDLVSWGWMRRQRIGKMKANVYQVLMDCELDQAIPMPSEQEQLAETANHVTCPPSKSHLPLGQITLAETANPIGTPFFNTVSNTKPERESAPDLKFEEAWKLYNSTKMKVGQTKKPAKAQWPRAVKRAGDPERLLKAISSEVAKRRNPKAFIANLPDMHRWLRDDRWQDAEREAKPTRAPLAPDRQLSGLEQAFQHFARTGEWTGDRLGHALPPTHPSASYDRELYTRFGVSVAQEQAA